MTKSSAVPPPGSSWYNDMFGEFLDPAGNEQYHYMLRLERGLFEQMQRRFGVFDQSQSLSMIDWCCGQGTNMPLITQAVVDATGVPSLRYTGVDIQPDSINAMTIVMRQLHQRGLVTEDSMPVQANAFTGFEEVRRKADLKGKRKIGALRHGLYYMESSVDGQAIDNGAALATHEHRNVNDFLRGAMNEIEDKGFMLAFHERACSELFCPDFNYTDGTGRAVSKMTDAAERLGAAAARHGYHMSEVKFAPKLFFPLLKEGELEQLRGVDSPEKLARLGEAQKRWFKLLLFAVQPPIEEFAAYLASAGFQKKLDLAIERMKGRKPPYLLIDQSMQVFTRDRETAQQLKVVCDDLQHQIDTGALANLVEGDMAAAQKNKMGTVGS